MIPISKYMTVLAVLMLSFWGPGTQAQNNRLIVMYNEIPPYITVHQGHLGGFVWQYLDEVFTAAGVDTLWENVPWANQLPTLQRGVKNTCTAAVFKTEGRELYALFSSPIGVDKGFVLVGRKAHPKLGSHALFRDVYSDHSLTAIFPKHAVFSQYINGLTAQRKPNYTSASVPRMLRRIVEGKDDYVLMSSIRALIVLNKYEFADKLQVYGHYQDIISDTPYYLACSKNTDPDLLAHVNAEIKRKGMAVYRQPAP